MRRTFVAMLAVTIFLRLVPAVCALPVGTPVPVTVDELTSRSFDGDGQTVVFTGEAIGEALRAPGGSVWVNVLNGTAIGVVVDRSLAETVGSWGDYRAVGDTVHVVGLFNVACDEHGGDMDVHATAFKVIEPGFQRLHSLDWYKGVIGLVALAVAGLAARRSRRIRTEREGA